MCFFKIVAKSVKYGSLSPCIRWLFTPNENTKCLQIFQPDIAITAISYASSLTSPLLHHSRHSFVTRASDLMSIFKRSLITLTKKQGPMTELLRGSELPVPNIARRAATPNFGRKISNLPFKVKTKQMGALLVATDVLSTRISFF